MNEQISGGGSLPAGMTLRDYFAAQAPNPAENQTLLDHCAYRYRYADAMLAARATEPTADADGWIEWDGGECPVPEDTVVDVRLRNGKELLLQAALWCDWDHDDAATDIIAYRVVRDGGAA